MLRPVFIAMTFDVFTCIDVYETQVSSRLALGLCERIDDLCDENMQRLVVELQQRTFHDKFALTQVSVCSGFRSRSWNFHAF